MKTIFKPTQETESESYLVEFGVADVNASNIIVIQHNLRVQFPHVVVYDNSNAQMVPDSITYLDEDRLQIDLTTVSPISGVWHIRVSR